MSEPNKLLTLEKWAERLYGDAAPSIGTLRRWARDARIHPRPYKHGRTYFVEPDATYVSEEMFRVRPRLVDRIGAGRRRQA
ncbi:excisionase [Dokdonella soli]|uniref:Excisionase-like domain-containing protein n=1 Tax=Dokdonella soli TaxID=529810 RepID=A0ABN1IJ72_9GAMM